MVLFNEKYFDPLQIILSTFILVKYSFGNNPNGSFLGIRARLVAHWQKPRVGWVKQNVDGAM